MFLNDAPAAYRFGRLVAKTLKNSKHAATDKTPTNISSGVTLGQWMKLKANTAIALPILGSTTSKGEP
ncbi:hypothetical protein LB577_26100 [Mesorhizobium sp. B283B1A]|uniref:hypothetical protein n=1 Tax=Mesorhizobium sp. B283B1A TaxID=2876665 RepID=UPI001CD17C82|nr:hypothetical protein [Mesorhizobium sp. B283B1A]MCA0050385.1 hypothetical protein [Mesorhizobium sp. B283B1A]